MLASLSEALSRRAASVGGCVCSDLCDTLAQWAVRRCREFAASVPITPRLDSFVVRSADSKHRAALSTLAKGCQNDFEHGEKVAACALVGPGLVCFEAGGAPIGNLTIVWRPVIGNLADKVELP